MNTFQHVELPVLSALLCDRFLVTKVLTEGFLTRRERNEAVDVRRSA